MKTKKLYGSDAQGEFDFSPTAAEVEAINVAQICKFRDTYWAYTTRGEDIRDMISPEFINRLARDATEAKSGLREMFRRSQYWHEDLQALAVPKVHKHTLCKACCRKLVENLLFTTNLDNLGSSEYSDLFSLRDFFAKPDNEAATDEEIAAFERLGVRCWRKKKTAAFQKLLQKLNLWTDTSGSSFQKCWAKYCEERTEKDMRYTLYISINPAHFLSMSNPKGDTRNEMLTSCHSMNSDYDYKSGCIGYARDKVSFIVFVAADNGLMNRKTSRQVFFYHNGALIQQRLYTSRNDSGYGGINNAEEYWEYEEYRKTVQNEIAFCEGANSFWRTCDYRNKKYRLNKFGVKVEIDYDFGGYADWEHFAMTKGIIRISVRSDKVNSVENFTAGAAGLHLKTAEEIRHGIDR